MTCINQQHLSAATRWWQ